MKGNGFAFFAVAVLGAALLFFSPDASAQYNCETPLQAPTKGKPRSSGLMACGGDGGGYGGGGAPAAPPSIMTIGESCALPGPHDDARCTVLFHVYNNPADYKICLWAGNSLVSCEGRTYWGGSFDHVTAAGASLEFRHHNVWPSQDPDWPNAERVRLKAQLLKSQTVYARQLTARNDACGLVVYPGQSIQPALDSGVATVCLAAGTHAPADTLRMASGQTLRSYDTSQRAVIVPAAGKVGVTAQWTSGAVIRDLVIEGAPTARPTWGILAYGTRDLLVERVRVANALYSIGVSENSSNVEVRLSEVANGGDGVACSGCAHPSIWINQSSDVRITKSVISNTGNGPEGDGELACYNTPGLVVQNSTITGSGAAGMYLVNCDRAVVIGNLVRGAREWGLDIVDADQPSGTDFGLFQWNTVENSRNGGAVLRNSLYNTFTNNTWRYNLQGGSGSCHGVNLRDNYTGFYQVNDVATPWPVACRN